MTDPTRHEPHPYCAHDEDEPCTCATDLRRHIPEQERKQGRRR